MYGVLKYFKTQKDPEGKKCTRYEKLLAVDRAREGESGGMLFFEKGVGGGENGASSWFSL